MATTEDAKEADQEGFENLDHKEKTVLKSELIGLETGDVANLLDVTDQTVYNKRNDLVEKGFLEKEGRGSYSPTPRSRNIPLEITSGDVLREDRKAVVEDTIGGVPRSETVEKIDVSSFADPLQKVSYQRNWLVENNFLRKVEGKNKYVADEKLVEKLHQVDAANRPGTSISEVDEKYIQQRIGGALELVFGDNRGDRSRDRPGQDRQEDFPEYGNLRDGVEEFFSDIVEHGDSMREDPVYRRLMRQKQAGVYLAEMFEEVGSTFPLISDTHDWDELAYEIRAREMLESDEILDDENLSIDLFLTYDDADKVADEFDAVFGELEPGEEKEQTHEPDRNYEESPYGSGSNRKSSDSTGEDLGKIRTADSVLDEGSQVSSSPNRESRAELEKRRSMRKKSGSRGSSTGRNNGADIDTEQIDELVESFNGHDIRELNDELEDLGFSEMQPVNGDYWAVDSNTPPWVVKDEIEAGDEIYLVRKTSSGVSSGQKIAEVVGVYEDGDLEYF